MFTHANVTTAAVIPTAPATVIAVVGPESILLGFIGTQNHSARLLPGYWIFTFLKACKTFCSSTVSATEIPSTMIAKTKIMADNGANPVDEGLIMR
jgi:hypothetical protein